MSLFLESLKLRAQAVDACEKLLDLLPGADTRSIDAHYKEFQRVMDQMTSLRERITAEKRRQRARHFGSMRHEKPRTAGNRVEHVETNRLGTCTGFLDNGLMGVTYDDNNEKAYDVTEAFRRISEGP